MSPYQTESEEEDDTYRIAVRIASWVTVLYGSQTNGSAGGSYPQHYRSLFTFGAQAWNCLNLPRLRSRGKCYQSAPFAKSGKLHSGGDQLRKQHSCPRPWGRGGREDRASAPSTAGHRGCPGRERTGEPAWGRGWEGPPMAGG